MQNELTIQTRLYSKKAEALFIYLKTALRNNQTVIRYNNHRKSVFSRTAYTGRLLNITRDPTTQIALVFPKSDTIADENGYSETITINQTSIAQFYNIDNIFARQAAIARHLAELIETELVPAMSEPINVQVSDKEISLTKDDVFIIIAYLKGSQPAYAPEKINEVIGSADNPFLIEVSNFQQETLDKASEEYLAKLGEFLSKQDVRRQQLIKEALVNITKQLLAEYQAETNRLQAEYQEAIQAANNLANIADLDF